MSIKFSDVGVQFRTICHPAAAFTLGLVDSNWFIELFLICELQVATSSSATALDLDFALKTDKAEFSIMRLRCYWTAVADLIWAKPTNMYHRGRIPRI